MFIYTDNICVVCNEKQLIDCETTLNKDLKILEAYFKQWRLRPNPDKTESSLFHLNNKSAYQSLNIIFCGNSVQHNPYPKYFGVTLDRTLTYKTHLANTAAKIGSRNNIIQKLTGTDWGADFNSLITSTVSLVYSVAEYCSPV